SQSPWTGNSQYNERRLTWKSTWDDILSGGPLRWKVDDPSAKEKALAVVEEHSAVHVGDADGKGKGEGKSLRILCPLAGDDPFVSIAWKRGHDVTAIDVVPDALRLLRDQIDDDGDRRLGRWTSEDKKAGSGGGGRIWRHRGGRATLYEGDALARRPELIDSFDAVYDKDSFGALDPASRPAFCERLAEFVRDGGTVYVEVKNKDGGKKSGGPPFHIEKEDLTTSFGPRFEYVAELGEVYSLEVPTMKQMGHVLRRLPRR
ncbi:hypothetical protein ACHAWF_000647, partial [Thalassiosira exigua]